MQKRSGRAHTGFLKLSPISELFFFSLFIYVFFPNRECLSWKHELDNRSIEVEVLEQRTQQLEKEVLQRFSLPFLFAYPLA